MESSAFVKTYSFVLIVGLPVTSVVLVAIFVFLRIKGDVLVNQHNALPLFIVTTGALIQLFWAIDSFNNGRGVSCIAMENHFLVVAMFQILPWFLLVFNFYCRVTVQKKLASFELLSAVVAGADPRLEELPEDQIFGSAKVTTERSGRKKSILGTNVITRLRSTATTVYGIGSEKYADVSDYPGFPGPILFFLASQKFTNWFQIICIMLAIVSVVVRHHKDDTKESPCDETDGQMIATIVLLIVLVPLLLAALWLIRKEPDPLYLRTQYLLIIGILFFLGLPVMILNLRDPGNKSDDGEFRWMLLWVTLGWLHVLVAFGLPIYRAFQDRKALENKSGAAHHVVDLLDVLAIKEGRHRFKAFLVSEFCVENYFLWNDVIHYKRIFNESSEDEHNVIRHFILEHYLRPNAAFSVNVSFGTRSETIRKIENDPPQITDFDAVFTEVIQLMSRDPFLRFCRTESFQALNL